MKKLILLFLITGCIDVSAQSHFKNKYMFGCKLGMVATSVTGGRVKSNAKASPVGGMWLQLKLSKKWAAQAELLFVEKGVGGHGGPHNNGHYWIGLYYFEAPILFQYQQKKFTLEFGPGLGALVYGHEILWGAPSPDLTDGYPFSKKEFSFNLGVGYSFNEKWYLGFRFTHSLLPVRKQIPDISKEVYSRVIALTLSWQLKSKRKAKEKEEQG